ncbi:adenine-specific DNA methylase [Gottschalkia acidurici 9a]|uniref:site-specific DNA-methyltransferase (adenine-specific) n=1 Tax=Gottschalkia acidurici (strain ATCC 7906 / DSM 604 / BCRC 14475 / CIP 104303 / KCTC 5404 / NCIMB 10678 / 9a) TaxID=1128398 RepID=K0AYU0_GOTA9|nr:N-6 DNA methylase [Gottschalkia acidurici]AFS77952.1 adenine-specific DNA methylase [Gottschalkia acidurici 9a]
MIIIQFNDRDISNIIKLSENNIEEDYEYIFKGIDKKHDYRHYLNEDNKLDIIRILVQIDSKAIKDFSIGEIYENFTTSKEKKLLGQVYTPKNIVEYMVSITINDKDIINNPYFKIIDPACGGGYFLIEAYKKIKQIMYENYDKIIIRNRETERKLNEDGIHKFIIENNIWGVDIDEFAIYMTKFSLIIKDDITNINTNIFKLDPLIDENDIYSQTFDLVLCNPPYIGHKRIDKDYRKVLEKLYSEVYSDKGDISYCFFKKGYQLLKNDGKLFYITSRYFQESQSGEGLRKFINENLNVNKIIDFYGENPFKGIGISPVMIECTKNKSENNIINVSKGSEMFDISQKELLNSGWVLLSEKEKKLLDKIDKSKSIKLGEICTFNQGIITGHDKAFIVSKEEIEDEQLEKNLIKPWIKNSDVERFKLKDIKKYIIYTDKIDIEENYPNSISHVEQYKDKLTKRRECIKGTRKWYELQWGRNEDLFKKDKIVFPYKANRNKFTIVREEVCSSADIYFVTIKNEFKHRFNLEYLAAFLNSSIFEYYLKCVAKKLNDKLYEYYPNKMMELNIIVQHDTKYVENLVKDIEYCYRINNYVQVEENIESIDKWFYDIYKLSREEIDIIENVTNTEGRL